jgi:hypothetical protein
MFTEKTFHCSFWRLWVRISFVNTAIAIIICTTISQLANGYPIFNYEHFLLIVGLIAAIAILAIPFVLAHIYYFPIVVTPAGIAGYTYIYPNKRVHLAWSEITLLQKRNRMGVPCFRLYSESRDIAILMPTDLKNKKEIQDLFIKHGLKDKGAASTAPQIQPTKTPKPITTLSEPIREGGYIIISTERQSSGKNS